MRVLVVAVHDHTDQLACVHLAESQEERDEVVAVAGRLGPVWCFEVKDEEPLQEWLP